MFGLTTQLTRAAVSISLNIAEGSSRTKKEFRHFLDIARGSCYECVAILTITKNQLYISEKEYKQLYGELNILTKKINALKSALL
jgi:four helix bundle protein